ncbi:CST complex subunit TEN1-like [Senna tora]|uniref:CST complex subunit TEN1-like n=1 Tax=Senna tora TaxID=362788 RepID=A0A834X5D1_9FABA|nr:CST complex subunit TEN1-like [Senna tora]
MRSEKPRTKTLAIEEERQNQEANSSYGTIISSDVPAAAVVVVKYHSIIYCPSFSRLHEYSVETSLATIVDGDVTLKVSTQHLRSLTFRVGSIYQFIGELLIQPDNKGVLQARVGRNVDGIDLNLYHQSLLLVRQFQVRVPSAYSRSSCLLNVPFASLSRARNMSVAILRIQMIRKPWAVVLTGVYLVKLHQFLETITKQHFLDAGFSCQQLQSSSVPYWKAAIA